MKHRIVTVDAGSIAEELGIRPNWKLVSMNGETVRDVIDYELFSGGELVTAVFEDENGEENEFEIEKEPWETLGLGFETGLMSPVRQCSNHCVFCFIDQMPKGYRGTLYFKDDDWRLSLIMGNYVTLTNVLDAEFSRIIERRVSPLYISVHATDGEVRRNIMRSKNADRIMERLTALNENGLRFHAQVVLCPGLNDGKILDKTLSDLASLRPGAASVAVVPLGLTRHREGLYPLSPMTRDDAKRAVKTVEAFNEKAGGGFCFCSDEMYLRAGLPLPPYEYYGDFHQIENGVGLYRLLEDGFVYALSEMAPLPRPVAIPSFCGTAIAGYMQELFDRLIPYNIRVTVHPVRNDFFGESVTVSGLVTAGDIIKQYAGKVAGAAAIIPSTMLRERDDVFLDGTRLKGLSDALGMEVVPVTADDGEALVREIFELSKRIIEK